MHAVSTTARARGHPHTLGISVTVGASSTRRREGAATPRYTSSTVGGAFTLPFSTCKEAVLVPHHFLQRLTVTPRRGCRCQLWVL